MIHRSQLLLLGPSVDSLRRTATTSPRAQTSPCANTLAATTTFRSLTSFAWARTFERHTQRGGSEILDMERTRDKAYIRFCAHFPTFGTVGVCRRCACAVAIDQRGNQTAVDPAGDCHVTGFWLKPAECLLTLPIALDVETLLI